jgi:hypothetical protein
MGEQRRDDEGPVAIGVAARQVLAKCRWKSGRDVDSRPGQLEGSPRKGLATGREPEIHLPSGVLHPEADGPPGREPRDDNMAGGRRPARAMGKG